MVGQSTFLQKLLFRYPELLNSPIHFCPSPDTSVHFILRHDGHIEETASAKVFKDLRAFLADALQSPDCSPLYRKLLERRLDVTKFFFTEPKGKGYRLDRYKSPLSASGAVCGGISWPGFAEFSDLIKEKDFKFSGANLHALNCSGKADSSDLCCCKCKAMFVSLHQQYACLGFDSARFKQLSLDRISQNAVANGGSSQFTFSACKIRAASCVQFSPSRCCANCAAVRKYLSQLLRRSSRAIRRPHCCPKRWATSDSKHPSPEMKRLRAESRKQKYMISTLRRRITKSAQPAVPKEVHQCVKSAEAGLLKMWNQFNSPSCLWSDCAFSKCSSSAKLWEHLKNEHLSVQCATNDGVKPRYKKYYCQWTGCNFKSPFKKLNHLRNHLRRLHVGSKDVQHKFEALSDGLNNLGRIPQGYRWGTSSMAITLANYGSRGSKQRFRNMSALPSPSLSTISDYKNITHGESGWRFENMARMRSAFDAAGFTGAACYGCLVWDEVYIKSSLMYKLYDHSWVGFADLPNHKTGAFELATTALQFYWTSLFCSFRFPCAYYLCSNTDAVDLCLLVQKGIQYLSYYGFGTLVTCCDGSAVNRNAINLMSNTKNYEYPKVSQNLWDDWKILHTMDFVHNAKKLRNSLESTSKSLRINGAPASWGHVIQAFEWDSKLNRPHTQLTPHHVHLSGWAKMNTNYAVHVFAQEVINVLKILDEEKHKGTILYLTMCKLYWEAMSLRVPLIPGKPDLNERLLKLQTVMDFADSWFKTTKENGSTAYEFMTMQCYQDLKTSITSTQLLVKHVFSEAFQQRYPDTFLMLPRVSQDSVEIHFSKARAMAGGSSNMTCLHYGQNNETIMSNFGQKYAVNTELAKNRRSRLKEKANLHVNVPDACEQIEIQYEEKCD